MNSSHDAWADLTALLEHLTKATSPLSTEIAGKILELRTGMSGGGITELGERDMQTVCEALMQSVRPTKHERQAS